MGEHAGGRLPSGGAGVEELHARPTRRRRAIRVTVAVVMVIGALVVAAAVALSSTAQT